MNIPTSHTHPHTHTHTLTHSHLIDSFISQLTDNYPWNLVLLQEAFSRTDGFEFDGRHVMFTPDKTSGNLRCPAILVNQDLAHSARFLGSDVRWIAVELRDICVFVSLHLPHVGRGFHEFISCLHALEVFLSAIKLPVYIGMDANTQVSSIVDHLHVGDGVPRTSFDLIMCERASLLHNFLCCHSLYLTNTFLNEPIMTRVGWDGSTSSQIDFIAAPLRSHCVDVGVDHFMHFNTDHLMVWACFMQDMPVVSAKKSVSLRNWQPGSSWVTVSADLNWDWHDWNLTTSAWHEAAAKCSLRAPQPRDEVLVNLLREHARASFSDKRRLNKLIWRRRRALKRIKARNSLRVAAERGSLPASQPKSVVVNWSKLCGGGDPQSILYDYFADIYSLCPSEVLTEESAKQGWMDKWSCLRVTMPAYQISVPMLSKAIAKLKNGKGSPDGCTAEMFKQLPPQALHALAIFYTYVFCNLVFPEAWSTVGAVLIPKVVGATSLSKFRAIACLPVARKLLGYLWLQSLPRMVFQTFQCGFVPGSHAANGVYVIRRISELAREWKVPVFVAQLDLKKAFDRVFHSAILKALLLQNVSLQSIGILAALLKQSTTMISLGQVCARPVEMHRGLPQGAPESPLLFALVTEMVLRPLLSRWRAAGWTFDSLHLSAVCYADDVLLVSRSKEGLESMVADVIEGFVRVGLAVSTEKCHWSSYPSFTGTSLSFGADQVEWETSLTFVGTILDLNGNDGLAIAYRRAQATKVYFKWKQVLQCPSAPLRCRVELLTKTVVPAVLWLSETWHPTKRQSHALNSWAARLVGQVVGVRHRSGDDVGDFWRRLHRVGHSWLNSCGGSIDARRRRRLHGFAGHLARSNEGLARDALRTRSLAWWRHFQAKSLMCHPGPFNAWRWEDQLEQVYGQSSSVFIDVNVGWMAIAQDRHRWRDCEQAFAMYSS